MDEQSDIIDWSTFGQITDLDEDDNREFSRRLVEKYYEQANQTFANMDEALASGDVEKLRSLGHFLKGSSASLGLVKVQNTCEEIQHIDGQTEQELRDLIERSRLEHDEVSAKLDSFYGA